MTTLQNKTALVTGASRGIGRATALVLARAGAHVLVHYGRSTQEAESLVAEIQTKNGRATAISVDLETSDGASLLAKQVRSTVGDRLDVLVLNAGISKAAPVMDLTSAPYGGARYSVETRMDGRIFARFHLDAGVGDVVIQPLETAECLDWLGFAGIEKPRVRMISREQQLAEKIHAYTLPRSSPNSRVKDLVDLALLIADNQLDRRRVIDALNLTFDRRGTHALPTSLSEPPSEWQTPFRALAEECGLQTDIAAVFDNVREFLENVLEGDMEQ
jgi:hypothetical protein